jgi:hypothetical protein
MAKILVNPQCFLGMKRRNLAPYQDRIIEVASKLAKVTVRRDCYRAGFENTIRLIPFALYFSNEPFKQAAESASHGIKNSDNGKASFGNYRGLSRVPQTPKERPGLFKLNSSMTLISQIIGSGENVLNRRKKAKQRWTSLVRTPDE